MAHQYIPTSVTPHFNQALAANAAREVHMDKVEFISFENGQAIKAIGTQNMNGGTVVAVVSKKGAVLARIPPLPRPTLDPNVGINNVREKMAEFVDHLTNHRELCGPERKMSLIVCAVWLAEAALPHHIQVINTILRDKLEHHPQPQIWPYEVRPGGQIQANQGTVFIDGRNGVPQVYVENRKVYWDEMLS
ncbi:hypothetical protein BDV28DRAFT_140665 [Aspergillus coremiiformis]|uniref:Uncharacterized protein n=1 Tax=Aspergillus coremiiformis TaxID=138285 RepID=A0A5N6YW53_9EURO|nr:hypothetical protein BDV28DRAFT_140665 [Aspergillus coremiiformis]